MTTELIGGRFRTLRLLGSGTMGQVWLATDERLQRSVAVKVVIPENMDPAQTLRLEREARAAAAVQHANVVRVFDFLDDGDRTLIVMEYVEGETLADLLQRLTTVPYDDAAELTAQICDGLSAAHRLNLVHRDLKPANVIITEDGMAKILDFGIAKRTGHLEATLTQTGAVLGTPQYMGAGATGWRRAGCACRRARRGTGAVRDARRPAGVRWRHDCAAHVPARLRAPRSLGARRA